MDKDNKIDESTLKDLEPSQYWEMRFSDFRNNLRNHGSFRLKLRRPSRSPAFSRPYIPGDPLNMIDWKVFARTDQLLVREENDESSARILVCLDYGDTMCWPPPDLNASKISKVELALRVGLNLAFIHYRMADLVKVVLWSGEKSEPDRVLPMRSATDAVAIYHRLNKAGITKASLMAESDSYVWRERKFDRVYWISDALGTSRLAWLQKQACFVHMLHSMSSLEIDVSWLDNSLCYFDQSEVRREYLGRVLRDHDGYKTAVERWRTNLSSSLLSSGNYYQLITDVTSIHRYQEELVEALR